MKKPARKSAYSAYSNLSAPSNKPTRKGKRAAKKEAKARAKAEYLASLPKNPIKRFFYRLHPKRFFKYWFSLDGLKMLAKIVGVAAVILIVFGFALFAYYRKELSQLSPEELAKRVQTTVSKYYDRNGKLLWEDKGGGNYRLVVDSDQISQYMKDATVAIEDKDYYKHGGVSFSGIMRAALSNVGIGSDGGGSQGGSTLTQQLVKQVFFSDEATERGLAGIPRKIKEAILSIEAERMYSKDQLLTLYLNESPYGGLRNGVESGAQTYFGKSAKNLTIAEAALLAAIPQSPTYFNPYNTDGNKDLLARQRTVIDYMAEQGYIKPAEAAAAKKVPILDTIKPLSASTGSIKAPHFVQMVKSELENELGTKVVGQGGLTIKTTLDLRVQNIIDKQVDSLFGSYLPNNLGFDNAAVTMVDNQTGQILGMRGSRSYSYPDYGAVNAANSFIQPGSSIKPEVWAGLIDQKTGDTYGAGSIISDEPLPQSVYATGNGQSVRNADGQFKGNLPIRRSLGESRNIPVIKAMALLGRDKAVNTIHNIGDVSYCTDGVDQTVGLASAIGGCGAKQIEHANAFATFARMGTYKPVSSILEVKNADGQVIDKWKDTSKQAIDPQTAYIISDILSDANARTAVFGYNPIGMAVNGVKTATKTGTSDVGGNAKDLWMMSYSPKATLAVWYGNHVPKELNSWANSLAPGPLVNTVMHDTHYNVFEKDGTWKPGDWFKQPSGVQKLWVNGTSDLYPSWYDKSKASVVTTERITFDKLSKKRATDCTPEAAKIDIDIKKTYNGATGRTEYSTTNGYNPNENDDKHNCSDKKPVVGGLTATANNGKSYNISVGVSKGKYPITDVVFNVGGKSYNGKLGDNGTYYITVNGLKGKQNVSVTATDSGLYSSTFSNSVNLTPSNNGGNDD